MGMLGRALAPPRFRATSARGAAEGGQQRGSPDPARGAFTPPPRGVSASLRAGNRGGDGARRGAGGGGGGGGRAKKRRVTAG